MAYWNQIVQFNVSEQVAPEPSTLQNKAAIVSEQNTTIPTGSLQYINSPTALSTYLRSPTAINAIAWSAGTVTITQVNDLALWGVTAGQQNVPIIVQGAVPEGYNGEFYCTIGPADGTGKLLTLTYPLATNPGTATTEGTLYLGTTVWLMAANKTWWAQSGQTLGYYIFESGVSGTPTSQLNILTAVGNYINTNPYTIYNWGFLPGMDADYPDTHDFFLAYNTDQSLVKFYLPVDLSTGLPWGYHQDLNNTFLQLQTLQDAPPGTQLDVIAYMAFITNITPTSTNKLPPSSYSYLYGVVPPVLDIQTMKDFVNGNVNLASLGSEGGISNVILINGVVNSGSPMNVRYSIDWQQIQMNLWLTNAVINGSNDRINPLYYNQAGINRLQAVAANVASRAIGAGLALGTVLTTSLDPNVFVSNSDAGLYNGNYVINAVPFALYVAQNPGDYAQGRYGGFQISYIPQYGFKTVVINLNVQQLVTITG